MIVVAYRLCFDLIVTVLFLASSAFFCIDRAGVDRQRRICLVLCWPGASAAGRGGWTTLSVSPGRYGAR